MWLNTAVMAAEKSADLWPKLNCKQSKKIFWMQKGEYFDTSEWRNYPLKSSEAPLDFTHNEHIWPGASDAYSKVCLSNSSL